MTFKYELNNGILVTTRYRSFKYEELTEERRPMENPELAGDFPTMLKVWCAECQPKNDLRSSLRLSN